MWTRTRSSALFLVAGVMLSRSVRADDPLDAYRERFKAGLEHYRAGEYGDAIRSWEAIYRELGPSRGYRIAFDLARAYESARDISHAADAYLDFVDQVSTRRQSGDTIAPLVIDEEKQAIARLRELDAKQGKIVVDRGAVPVEVKIDDRDPRPAGFVAYVEPGSHVVTIDPGTTSASSHRVEIAAGSVFEMQPSSLTPLVSNVQPEPSPLAPDAAFPPPRAGVRLEKRTDHPFSPWVLGIAGGATLASIVIPAAAYVSATSFQASNHLSAIQNDPHNDEVRSGYDSRVSTFYATLAIPIALGVATAGLATFYIAGAKERAVTVTAGASNVVVSGKF